MSVEQLEQTVLSLSRKERRRFVQWFYEHEDELVGPGDDYIHPEVKAEILRRRAETIAHPELLEPWEGTIERAHQRLNEIRRQKAQTR
ncbi:MAG: hypothetical protein AAB466_09155 [Verrucomicrobiota bacterium]